MKEEELEILGEVYIGSFSCSRKWYGGFKSILLL